MVLRPSKPLNYRNDKYLFLPRTKLFASPVSLCVVDDNRIETNYSVKLITVFLFFGDDHCISMRDEAYYYTDGCWIITKAQAKSFGSIGDRLFSIMSTDEFEAYSTRPYETDRTVAYLKGCDFSYSKSDECRRLLIQHGTIHSRIDVSTLVRLRAIEWQIHSGKSIDTITLEQIEAHGDADTFCREFFPLTTQH